MAEYLLSDYFAGSGGAADDSTDCTAAFQAALDDIHANGKTGTLVFPSGICRMNGNVVKDMGFNGTPQGLFILKGTGDSAIRFVNTGEMRINIYNLETIKCENMVFLGNMATATTTEASQAHLALGGDRVEINNCHFYGLGMANSGITRGLVWANGTRQTVIRGCHFRGTWGNLNTNIYCGSVDEVILEDTIFLDYGVYESTSYSKGGGGCPHWLYVDNTGNVNSNRFSKVTVRNCFFDEGAQTSAIHLEDVRFGHIENITVNIPGAGQGLKFLRVNTLTIDRSTIGYAGTSKKGLMLEDVNYAEFSHCRFIPGTWESEDGTDTIELLGTTDRVVLKNFTRGNDGNLLDPIIVNTAGAEVIDATPTQTSSGGQTSSFGFLRMMARRS